MTKTAWTSHSAAISSDQTGHNWSWLHFGPDQLSKLNAQLYLQHCHRFRRKTPAKSNAINFVTIVGSKDTHKVDCIRLFHSFNYWSYFQGQIHSNLSLKRVKMLFFMVSMLYFINSGCTIGTKHTHKVDFIRLCHHFNYWNYFEGQIHSNLSPKMVKMLFLCFFVVFQQCLVHKLPHSSRRYMRPVMDWSWPVFCGLGNFLKLLWPRPDQFQKV